MPGGQEVNARGRPIQAKQAALAARRYFVDDRTIKEVASELGVSRFKASRLIEWARAEGMVRIEIVDPVGTDLELSGRLADHYGLRDALVLAGLDGPSDVVVSDLAEMAALVAAELVAADDVVGISWGHTLDLVVDRLPLINARRVVQLIGGLATMESASGGVELVRQLAAKARTSGYPLLAPVRLREPAAAGAVRRDPVVAETLRMIQEVTVVLAGVGSWDEPAQSRMIECFDAAEVRRLRDRGVVADLCGFLFSAEGKVVEALEAQRIGITLDQLDKAGTVLAVCGGSEKRRALGAVLRSQMVDIVVTDAGSAEALLGV